MQDYLDIVIPVFNEELSVPLLAHEINNALGTNSSILSWKCIWVDDGSTDSTINQINKLYTTYPKNYSYIQLKRNYGQSAALMAGFLHCRKNCLIATLDGDAQNDPADIPSMISLIKEKNVDMVTGIRVDRHDSLKRKISSKIANGFRNLMTGYHISDAGCSIRVMKRECIENIVPFKGMHRFLSTLAMMNGFKVLEVPVKHRDRKAGQSKYGINNRLWVGLADTFAIMWMKSRLAFAKEKECTNVTYSDA